MCSLAKLVLLSAVVVLSVAPSHAAPEKLFGVAQQQELLQQVQQQELLQQLQQPVVDGGGGVEFRQNGATARQNGDTMPAQYEFAYDVKVPEEGNDYGHAERRNGDTTEGMYRVLLPDGRVQVVTYSVIGNSGFVATVSYQ